MKYFAILAVLISNFAYSQEVQNRFIKVEANGFTNEDVNAGGAAVSFGYHSKGFTIGPGAGLYMYGKDDNLVPVYLNVGYSGKKRKLSPYIDWKLGWCFGGASLIEKRGDWRGNLFFDLSVGAAYPLGKGLNKVYAKGGILQFMEKDRYTKATQSIVALSFGVGLLMAN